MKRIIGVMGPGAQHASKKELDVAYEVGKLVAKSGSVLLCGAMAGVMEYSAKGAKEAGGLVLGIGPTGNKEDMNEYVDIPVVSNMHAARNYMNITSSDILVFVSVLSPGTLSELAFAIQLEKPSFIIGYSEILKAYIEELDAKNVSFVDSLEELSSKI